MEEKTEKFYTVEEASELLSVEKPLIFKLIQQGKLPAINIGSGQRNIYRIRMEDIYNLRNNKKENDSSRPPKNTENS